MLPDGGGVDPQLFPLCVEHAGSYLKSSPSVRSPKPLAATSLQIAKHLPCRPIPTPPEIHPQQVAGSRIPPLHKGARTVVQPPDHSLIDTAGHGRSRPHAHARLQLDRPGQPREPRREQSRNTVHLRPVTARSFLDATSPAIPLVHLLLCPNQRNARPAVSQTSAKHSPPHARGVLQLIPNRASRSLAPVPKLLLAPRNENQPPVLRCLLSRRNNHHVTAGIFTFGDGLDTVCPVNSIMNDLSIRCIHRLK